MSDRTYKGYVDVAQVSGLGMITVRGNLASTKLKAALKEVTGLSLPKQGLAIDEGDKAIAWMSPDELLVMLPASKAPEATTALNEALAGQHVLIVDVSDARAVFDLNGAKMREILAKLAPIDTHHDVLKPGMFRRTRFAQVAGAVHIQTSDKARIVAFRSVQDYMFELLCDAAKPGSEVMA